MTTVGRIVLLLGGSLVFATPGAPTVAAQAKNSDICLLFPVTPVTCTVSDYHDQGWVASADATYKETTAPISITLFDSAATARSDFDRTFANERQGSVPDAQPVASSEFGEAAFVTLNVQFTRFVRGCYNVFMGGRRVPQEQRDFLRAIASGIDANIKARPCPSGDLPSAAALEVGLACDTNDLHSSGSVSCSAAATNLRPDARIEYQWTVDGQVQPDAAGNTSTTSNVLALTGVSMGPHTVTVLARDAQNGIAAEPRSATFARGSGPSGLPEAPRLGVNAYSDAPPTEDRRADTGTRPPDSSSPLMSGSAIAVAIALGLLTILVIRRSQSARPPVPVGPATPDRGSTTMTATLEQVADSPDPAGPDRPTTLPELEADADQDAGIAAAGIVGKAAAELIPPLGTPRPPRRKKKEKREKEEKEKKESSDDPVVELRWWVDPSVLTDNTAYRRYTQPDRRALLGDGADVLVVHGRLTVTPDSWSAVLPPDAFANCVQITERSRLSIAAPNLNGTMTGDLLALSTDPAMVISTRDWVSDTGFVFTISMGGLTIVASKGPEQSECTVANGRVKLVLVNGDNGSDVPSGRTTVQVIGANPKGCGAEIQRAGATSNQVGSDGSTLVTVRPKIGLFDQIYTGGLKTCTLKDKTHGSSGAPLPLDVYLDPVPDTRTSTPWVSAHDHITVRCKFHLDDEDMQKLGEVPPAVRGSRPKGYSVPLALSISPNGLGPAGTAAGSIAEQHYRACADHVSGVSATPTGSGGLPVPELIVFPSRIKFDPAEGALPRVTKPIATTNLAGQLPPDKDNVQPLDLKPLFITWAHARLVSGWDDAGIGGTSIKQDVPTYPPRWQMGFRFSPNLPPTRPLPFFAVTDVSDAVSLVGSAGWLAFETKSDKAFTAATEDMEVAGKVAPVPGIRYDHEQEAWDADSDEFTIKQQDLIVEVIDLTRTNPRLEGRPLQIAIKDQVRSVAISFDYSPFLLTQGKLIHPFKDPTGQILAPEGGTRRRTLSPGS